MLEANGSMTPIPAQLIPGQLIRRPDGAIYAVGDSQRGTRVAYSTPNGTLLADGRLVVSFTYSKPPPTQVLCGVVALLDNGDHDPTFGVNGIVSMPQAVCRVDHFADDTIRVDGDFGDPVVSISPNGAPLGSTPAPLDDPDLAFAGGGGFCYHGGPGEIVGLDPLGTVDPTFGINGIATLSGMAIDGSRCSIPVTSSPGKPNG